MHCRRCGSKPTLALWMLVAAADLAILVAGAGVLALLLILAGLAVVAGGVLAVRLLSRTDVKPAKMAVRRRA